MLVCLVVAGANVGAQEPISGSSGRHPQHMAVEKFLCEYFIGIIRVAVLKSLMPKVVGAEAES